MQLDCSGAVAKLTLTRPKKLNSLSYPMIMEMRSKYGELNSAGVKCLILRGEGRALCAGGDVAEVRQGVLEGSSQPADFFYEEYQLDYEIATLHQREGIVQVSLWDGIVMGGGVGLSIHSPIRIATEKTLFAMPETGIGLFPDVGATWALSRLKAGSHVGIYLGMTGQRLGPADCLFAGLATHFCPSDRLAEVEAALRMLGPKAGDVEAAAAAIAAAASTAVPDSSKAILSSNCTAIERCFGDGSLTAEEICSRLIAEDSDWGKSTLSALKQRSPTSVKVALEAIKRHQQTSLREAFVTEYRISQWCMRPPPESDFCEGIRAVLVDKDNKPNWQPSRLEDVTRARVESFFAPLGPEHPRGELKLC